MWRTTNQSMHALHVFTSHFGYPVVVVFTWTWWRSARLWATGKFVFIMLCWSWNGSLPTFPDVCVCYIKVLRKCWLRSLQTPWMKWTGSCIFIPTDTFFDLLWLTGIEKCYIIEWMQGVYLMSSLFCLCCPLKVFNSYQMLCLYFELSCKRILRAYCRETYPVATNLHSLSNSSIWLRVFLSCCRH